MAFEASAVAPVRPAELLGDDSDSAAQLYNTQNLSASAWRRDCRAAMALTGYYSMLSVSPHAASVYAYYGAQTCTGLAAGGIQRTDQCTAVPA
jgi:hypothetical protein